MAADERVRTAEAAVREACAELRWNEALRRRWREARAEAAIRGAIASGGVEGAAHGVVGRGGVALGGGHGGVAEEALDGEQVAAGELGGPAGAGWRA